MSRVPKLFAVLSVLGALTLTGCGGDDPDDSADPGESSSDVGAAPEDGSTGAPDQGDADDEDEPDGDKGDKDGGGAGEDEPEPAVDPGPCEAVLPFSEVEGILDDPEPGTLSSGGEVINSCTWTGAGDETLLVEARDPSFAGLQGIDPELAENPIEDLGEEAGSAVSKKDPPTAEVQVWAFLKGSGKALPVLYVVKWTGSDAEVGPLVAVAERIV